MIYRVVDKHDNRPFGVFDKKADAEKFAKDIMAEFPYVKVKVVTEKAWQLSKGVEK